MNILVVSPHPDDETLGAGGSILRLKEEGHKIFWMNMTSINEKLCYSREQIENKTRQIELIKEFYQFEEFYNLGLCTTKLGEYDESEIIAQISRFFDKIKPNVIFLPDYNDAHSDHLYTFNWCYACSKIFRHPYIKYILTMEIISETNFGKPINPFIPNIYINIQPDVNKNYLERKIEAMEIYSEEIGEHPFPRSVESMKALAILRGSESGTDYAEGFRLIKGIL